MSLLLNIGIGIDIFIRNHLGVLLLAKVVPRYGDFSMDVGELLDIIESYILRLFLHKKRLIIENDSLIAIHSLNNQYVNIFDLGALTSNF